MKVYIVTGGDEIKEVFAEEKPAEEYAELLSGYRYVVEKELLQNVFKINEYWEFSVAGREYGCSINIRHDYSPLMKYTREEIVYSGNRTTAGRGWTHISRERAEELAEEMRKTYLDDMANPKSERYNIINDTSPLMSAHTSMIPSIPAHNITVLDD